MRVDSLGDMTYAAASEHGSAGRAPRASAWSQCARVKREAVGGQLAGGAYLADGAPPVPKPRAGAGPLGAVIFDPKLWCLLSSQSNAFGMCCCLKLFMSFGVVCVLFPAWFVLCWVAFLRAPRYSAMKVHVAFACVPVFFLQSGFWSESLPDPFPGRKWTSG
jgi:hypothetical protein